MLYFHYVVDFIFLFSLLDNDLSEVETSLFYPV